MSRKQHHILQSIFGKYIIVKILANIIIVLWIFGKYLLLYSCFFLHISMLSLWQSLLKYHRRAAVTAFFQVVQSCRTRALIEDVRIMLQGLEINDFSIWHCCIVLNTPSVCYFCCKAFQILLPKYRAKYIVRNVYDLCINNEERGESGDMVYFIDAPYMIRNRKILCI